MPQINAAFKFNPEFQRAWREAIGELSSLMKKTDPEGVQKLVGQSAARFIKNVAAVTPPATGTLDSQAKAAGEQAVLDDLLKIAVPVTISGSRKAARDVMATAEDLLAAHERARVGAAGRVNPRSRREKLFVENAQFNRVVSKLQARVGWLAAGLNAAAERLGVRLPAWIKRHGTRFGKIEVLATDSRIRIRMIQDVPFTDNVKGYERHWNFALQKEITSLHGMIKAIWHRKTHKAAAHFKK